jgi:hypothetical protein
MRLIPAEADFPVLAAFQRAVTAAQARLEAHGAVHRERVLNTELNRIALERNMIPLPQLLPIAAFPDRDAASNLVYHRATRGPINDDWLTDHLPADRRAYYLQGEGRSLWRNSMLRYEITNYIDGMRSAFEIRNEVSAEFGLQPLITIVTYLHDLETAGLLVRPGARPAGLPRPPRD